MTKSITNPKKDLRSISHSGSELGESNVALHQNEPNREDAIVEWTCPRKFDQMTYSAGDHLTKFYPRCREELDGDGTETTFPVDANLAPPNGQTTVAEMKYQPVVAYDDEAEEELTVEYYDFDQNEVTFEEAPEDGSGNVIVWPIITEGLVKYVGQDQFDNQVAALDQWGIPIHVFNDFNQTKRETKVHLTGAAVWEESETLAVHLNSERQIVWEDSEYPRGTYASTIEQRVFVDV